MLKSFMIVRSEVVSVYKVFFFLTNPLHMCKMKIKGEIILSFKFLEKQVKQYMLNIMVWLLVYGVECHFQHYFSYIMVVSSIGGGNRTTRRKPLTCCKSMTNFIT